MEMLGNNGATAEICFPTYIILDIERDRLFREDEMRGQRPTNKVAKEPDKLGGI